MNLIADKQLKDNNVNRQSTFWHQRATHYDKLFWTKDKGYLDKIIKVAKFKKTDLVLDVGVGTGVVSKRIKPYIKHVVGIDISKSMLQKGKWEGISTIKWDIRDALFANSIFDKVIARMCFHHIIDNLDLAILRCYDLLKTGGTIIVAEGLPPSNDPEVLYWYTEMFKLKEKRLTFTEKELKNKLARVGFKKISTYKYKMKSFSVKNWITNSGIDRKKQIKIINLHYNANNKIKNAYNMRCINNDCLIDTKHIIFVGKK